MSNTERVVEGAGNNTGDKFSDDYIPLDKDSFAGLHKGKEVKVVAVSDMIGKLKSETLAKAIGSDGFTLISPRLSAITPLGTSKTALELIEEALGHWAHVQ